MKKGRSNYSIQLNIDANVTNNLMQTFINNKNFKLYKKNGEQYYRMGDNLMGYVGLKYSINGQVLIIDAWLDGPFGNFMLEHSNLNMMAMNYRNSLNNLFQEIAKLNSSISNNQQVNTDITNQQTNLNNNPNQFAQTFQNENIKKQEKICEIGFWLSIIGLLSSFTGRTYGIIIYIMNFYFASQGLKTNKKGKAITTIILSILSILIIVLQFLAL